MKEFDSNKDNKLAELQKSLEALRKTVGKESASVKSLQKEVQASRLDSEQSGADLAAAQEELDEIDSAFRAQQEEISGLVKEQSQVKVRDSLCLVVGSH
jgi:structural maintenance of chromosome 2